MTDAIVLSAVSFRHADSPRPVLDSIDPVSYTHLTLPTTPYV